MNGPGVLSLCLLGILLAPVSSEEKKKSGPFDIELGEIGECDTKGNGDIQVENLMLKPLSKNVVEVSFDATNKVPFSDDVFVTAEIASYDPEKQVYGPKLMKIPVGAACKSLNTYFPKTIKKLLTSLGIENCPVKPGTWSVKKFPFEFMIPLSKLPYKKIRADVFFQREGAVLYCRRVYVGIVPEGSVKYS